MDFGSKVADIHFHTGGVDPTWLIRLLLKCALDNNIIPTTRGPTKPAVLATVGSFTKVEARRTPLAPATVYRAPHTGRWPPTPARRGRRDFTRVHLGTLGTFPVGPTNE